MKISAKGRYAIASMISIAQQYDNGENLTAISISNKLGISKIYMEQVFSLLKKGNIVKSVKGAQGGYQLSRSPQRITVYEILTSVETSLFEKTEKTVSKNSSEIETVMQKCIFDSFDDVIKDYLEKITLYELINEVEKYNKDQEFMFFI